MAAANEFKETLQQALSCASRTVLLVSTGGYHESTATGHAHSLTLAERPVALSGPSRIALSVDHHYGIVRADDRARFRITTAAYYYALRDVADPGAVAREILAYHWHPDVRLEDGTLITYPHLHVNRGAVRLDIADGVRIDPNRNLLRPDLALAHLPTRRIALEDMIRLAIEQFGVTPLRADWDTTLRASREAFRRERTWL